LNFVSFGGLADMTCPRCQQDNPTHARFCVGCGARLALACGSCGAELPGGARFCLQCGQGVAAGTAAPVRSPAPETYTPKHLAEKILSAKAALEGERKQVTVLFADLKGSMELIADRDPEEARKLLDPVLERMMEAVHRYEGTVNQVMGDGIMALFGAPVAHEDHAVRACYAALRMQELVKSYAEEVRRAHGITVRIRVGINSGEVVVRAIGNDLHMDYTAVGQTTHLASRMEQLADPGSILVSPATLELAGGYVGVRSLGPVPVKGLPDPVEVYELTGAGTARSRLQATASRGFTPFVGRDPELAHLIRAQEQARGGQGQLVAIMGEAGVGKSRLYHEFTHSHRVKGWLVLEASAMSHGKSISYLPVIDLLKGYCKLEDRDDHRALREKITGKLFTLDESLKPLLPAFFGLLDVPIDDPQWQALDPAQRRHQTLDANKRLLLREAQAQPVIVIFEDLHWVDTETQALLDSLVSSLPAARILMLVNYRPEYQHAWGSKMYYTQLRLDALPAESADELLEGLLGGDPALVPLKALLTARTSGNPLFLEESVRTLVETRALAGTRGAYRLAQPVEAIQVPATVQSILASRIDRLPIDEKRLLQSAAVIGKDVPFGLLQGIAGLPEEELRRELAHLQAAEFLYETSLFPDLEYTFKHALTHEVAYSGVLLERRRALHATILETLERLHADRLGEHAEVLAHHAVRAAIPDKAVRYLREAGAKATARAANQEAVDFLERALALLAELPETRETLSDTLDVRIALGTPLIAVHGPTSPLVEASYLAALELVERLDDAARRFLVLWGLWYVSFTRGDYAPAVTAGERLLETAKRGDDAGQLLEAHHALWPTLVSMGEVRGSLPHLERGIELYDRERHGSYASLYGGHDPGTCCRYFLAVSQWGLGYPERALASVYEAARLAETLGHAMTSTMTLSFVTSVLYFRGDRSAAIDVGERCLAIIGAHGFRARGSDIAVILHAIRGDRPDVAALNVLEGKQALESMRTWRSVMSGCTIAWLYGDAGAPEQGLRVLAALGDAEYGGFYGSEIHRVEGELRRRIAPRAFDEASSCFHLAIDLARRRELRSLELRAATSLARLWRDQGKRAEARDLLAPVYGWFTEGFDTRDLKDAQALLAELG
jgi:class 3 adenylate cyclase/tetratricopeptide (TPR) repeat protein